MNTERLLSPDERNLTELLIPHYNPEAEAVRRFIADRALQLMFDLEKLNAQEELENV